MKFIDEAKIYVKSGHGGSGCVSFRREKYIPRGGPNGGDGGKGGDVVIRVSRSHSTLLDLKFNQHHVAKNGGGGEGSNKTGKNSPDVEVVVPVGTLVKDAETGEILADITADGQKYIVARGGEGGRGNARFATSTNRAPRYAQEGREGEDRWVELELKLLADVGIIGLPNVGKSTFISRVSASRPKIADYPFTTLKPNLGVVKYGNFETFVIADIPGLVKGAHRGSGLGIKFLRHIERTTFLLHILDISDELQGSPWEDFKSINNELALFSPALIEKPQIVALNKTDLTLTKERMKKEIEIFGKHGIKLFPISAVTGEGIKDLMNEILKTLQMRKVS
ncbi:MAG: GTPase ObgE [Thermodesulfobacteriota bacterium]|nr:GTPase ObgE [Thermodesulfobacteriota bacterium]